MSQNAATFLGFSDTDFQLLLYNVCINLTSDLYEHQESYGAKVMINADSPISPLSPEDSSPTSDTCTQSQSLFYQYEGNSHQWNDHYKWSFSNCKESSYQGIPYLSAHPHCQDSQFSGSHASDSFNSLQNCLFPQPTLSSGPDATNISHSSLYAERRSPRSPNNIQNCPSKSYSLQLMQDPCPDPSMPSLKHKLQELETALMGPESDDTLTTHICRRDDFQKGEWICTLNEFVSNDSHVKVSECDQEILAVLERRSQVAPKDLNHLSPCLPSSGLQYDNRSMAEQLLVSCAAAIANNDFVLANSTMTKLKQEVSVYGDPAQRLAAYMAEGLVARIASSGKGICKALNCKEAPAADLLSAMQKLYEICPYFKFGYMSANGAIADALKDEAKVHILDFEIDHGTQWISLIQALATRPGGPPCVRITGVGDPQSKTQREGGLQMIGQRLGKIAETVGVPFEFDPIPVQMAEVQTSMVKLRPGEALAVNFAFQLHHVPDESVCVTNPRDRLLQMVKGMNPKVLTLVEQESNINTTLFFPRFLEAWNYYLAVFDSIDEALPRKSKDRVSVEQQCLAREIVNIIACEGAERVERHELLGKWRCRMMMAGFKPRPLSSYVNKTIEALLQSYCEKYRLKEEGGVLFLGWLNRPLVVASAWH